MGGLCFVVSLLDDRETPIAFVRLLEVTKTTLPNPVRERRFKRMTTWLSTSASKVRGRFSWLDSDVLSDRFLRAGVRMQTPRDAYLMTRLVGPLVALIVALLIPFSRSFWLLALPALAYLTPDLLLELLLRRRRAKIRSGVPDVVDLLVICVDAGLGLDQALLRVGEELGLTYPEIRDELLQVNSEQRAGRPRAEAWQAMAKRTRVEEIEGLVNMLEQTERFGTPISKALSTFAGTVRQKRRQVAEEMAAKTTGKMFLPLVLFVFRALFIVLLGPTLISILRTLASSTH